MQGQNVPVCAAIDIGSNTLRLVVARCPCPDGVLDILETDEAIVRIGESVNATGAISSEKQAHALSVLQRFKALATKHSAQTILAIATEAIRKASNRDDFLTVIQQEAGIEVHCIDGDMEATLTFYGATYELSKSAQPPAKVSVMDMGGGSTELVIAKDMQISWHTSLPIGSGVIHDRYLTADPPTEADRASARIFLHTYLTGLQLQQFPPILFATGGSANTLLILAQRAFGLDTSHAILTHEDLVRCEGLLWALSAEEIAQRYQLDTKRARIITAGVLILLSLLETFDLKEVHISSYGIREGVALAYARNGAQWLAEARQQAHNVSQATSHVNTNVEIVTYHEEFITSGRRLFLTRAETMLGWRDVVLKHEDSEAVHKMRVASRRLRAVMDAYQSICQRRPFKAVYAQIKDIADALGIARDTDVMIDTLRQQLEQASASEQAGIRWLIDGLSEYRMSHQQLLEKRLLKLDKDALLRSLKACLAEEGEKHGKG
ncbi:Ppx/GppA phosphatase family protein [Dictyobacter arantiisoli]|uniref:Exopolyphosphatase n=1 Tax=Dictyobacter arantiisoli TaxID=2014874 RepID=A0A5A5TH51_9CHLR|nr:CHAD domain-containing protein [Dictyobacter arantiisoli]GCF10697.1 hypothetical protein KDI_42610 [Dictyobacter arantiisoli]